MKKRLSLIMMLIIPLCLFAGCAGNKVMFYIGTSELCGKNVRLEKGQVIEYKQNKITFEGDNIVFEKNDSNRFDALYFTFEGNNINDITFTSEKTKMLNTNLGSHSYYVDCFSIYKTFDEKTLNEQFSDCKEAPNSLFETTQQFDNMKILKKIWDNGEFNDIRNVYCNGLSSDRVFGTGSVKKTTYNITGIFANSNFQINESDDVEITKDLHVNYMGEETTVTDMVCQWDLENAFYDDNRENTQYSNYNYEDIVLQPENIKIDSNSAFTSVKWVYEMLYNDAYEKGIINDCVAEDTISADVHYAFGGKESYEIKCQLFANGTIKIELKEV